MEHFQPGEVVLLSFPFSDAAGAKRRPALVLRDTEDKDMIVARITSQVSQTAFDVGLANWEAAGLVLPSWVRVHKLATLQKRLVEQKLGLLTTDDLVKVQAVIESLWSSR